MPRIPFIVVGGFLGAGKTTLLNRWLAEAHGRRLAVLVNDFGEINVDAALLAQPDGGEGAVTGETIALSNGCVCCTIGGDLTQALIGVLARRPPFDAIVVECSGVADPWRVAQYALVDPALELAAVVVLADASALLALAADPLLAETIERPLAHADLVLLNKADLCTPDECATAQAWVEQRAPGIGVLPVVQAALPWAVIDGAVLHAARGGAGGPGGHGELFASWSFAPAGDFDADALRAWLRSLPAGVLRLKGLLRSADGGGLDVQFAGRHGTVRRIDAVSAPVLAAIGLRGRLPTAALAAGLQACWRDRAGALPPPAR